MALTIQDMVKAGMHFGHQSKRWNPRMAPYIYAERNGIHIIDIIQSYNQLQNVSQFLTQQAAEGKTFLFVGTKAQADRLVAKAAIACNSFYVNHRWLGGMLTNWNTIRTSIQKLNTLEEQEKNGELNRLPKKEAALLRSQKERLERNLGGLKNMKSLPDVVIIIGQQEEFTAVQECQKLGLRSITILDTDCDPQAADLFITANDDSISSIYLLLNEMLQAIQLGQDQYRETSKSSKKV
nr:Ribosomal protein S2 [Pedinophyceae sp. YPF-701]